MTLPRWIVCGACLLTFGAAGAGRAAQTLANTDPAAVKPGAYTLEPTHTQVIFSVSHMGYTTYYGRFNDPTGRLLLDPVHPEASRLDVSIPIATVSTTSGKLDGELRSADWLDAQRFPTATYHSTRVTLTGPRDAEVAGELTLHGVTRPLTLHAHFNGAGPNAVTNAYTVGFEVGGVIERSDFGVKKYVPIVGDETRLVISGAFEKAPG